MERVAPVTTSASHAHDAVQSGGIIARTRRACCAAAANKTPNAMSAVSISQSDACAARRPAPIMMGALIPATICVDDNAALNFVDRVQSETLVAVTHMIEAAAATYDGQVSCSSEARPARRAARRSIAISANVIAHIASADARKPRRVTKLATPPS